MGKHCHRDTEALRFLCFCVSVAKNTNIEIIKIRYCWRVIYNAHFMIKYAVINKIPEMKNSTTQEKSGEDPHDPGSQQFYHGTKADLKPGDLVAPGFNSNYGKRKKASYIYLTATLEAATWGAELAMGEGQGRIYIVEPTGPIEDDPNLTDKKFPGNPTKSYRSRDPLRVTGEVKDWKGHSGEQLKMMKDHLERLKELGIEAIED
jgi:hypothetical protein